MQVVSQLTEGGLHSYTYEECLERCKLVALAIQRLGIHMGDRVATMAWNNHRHLECWYADELLLLYQLITKIYRVAICQSNCLDPLFSGQGCRILHPVRMKDNLS